MCACSQRLLLHRVSDLLSHSEAETREFARRLARSLEPPAHVLLYGDLGAGKTTFTKGLAEGFGMADPDEVSSPTFTLVNQYAGSVPIYHVDLYRVDTGDIDDLGLDDIFDAPRAAVIVEWPERLGSRLPPHPVLIRLAYVDAHSRQIDVVGRGGSV